MKYAMTSLFWCGEPGGADNAGITNAQSYWDEEWVKHFGGVDDPKRRNGYHPRGFTPKENPFYFALPYGEFKADGKTLKASAKRVPWYKPGLKPLLKNRWIVVLHKGRICCGQWQDVGPADKDSVASESDFPWVFGKRKKPLNTFDKGAGLDLSPAMWDCLGMTDNAMTAWSLIEERFVPDGPWREIITRRA